EKRQLGKRLKALFGRLPKSLLALGVKSERMDKIGADQSPFEVIECGSLSVSVHSQKYVTFSCRLPIGSSEMTEQFRIVA
ncbi:hypothetical protein OFM41_32625, partial [Escherichia coli]|nr:hypothetical protein [Escherichia coli]